MWLDDLAAIHEYSDDIAIVPEEEELLEPLRRALAVEHVEGAVQHRGVHDQAVQLLAGQEVAHHIAHAQSFRTAHRC